ncbi:Uncharacterised protein [Mycobacteroides abscessus subsp. abscessus]|nr:Uncharacterised protein [Mycobacteroides abscessus subsp. abscessus]
MREAHPDGGEGEQRNAADEDPLAAEGVTQAAAEQHQPAEGQHVRGDHPAAGGVIEVQLGLNLGQRDHRDGAVHGGQELHTGDRDDGIQVVPGWQKFARLLSELLDAEARHGGHLTVLLTSL